MQKRGTVRRGAKRVAIGLVVAMAVACAPQPPAPALPVGIGMQWVRDTGGTLDGYGNYVEAYARLTLLDGVNGGPTPVPLPFIPLIPTAGPSYASFGVPVFPDGTARFPWNGFAGEGITTSTTVSGATTTYEVTGAGGTCRFSNTSATFATTRTLAAIPSPDGTKLAVYSRLNDFDANSTTTTLTIYSLDASCSSLTHASYVWHSSTGTVSGGMIVSPLTVWSPDSSTIVFALTVAASGVRSQLVRLDVAAGSSPAVVLDDPSSSVLPLGWSLAGRLLIVRSGTTTATQPVSSTSLETVPATGGHSTVFDVHTSVTPSARAEFLIGYFVPGTSLVLYSGGSRTATAADGRVVAWPQFRIFDDATGSDAAVVGTDAPLAWHTTPAGEMPNAEFLERFIR